MSAVEQWFRGGIRIVFLCAYGAFLFASVRHIAFFFSSFEPLNTDWTGSYWLAVSIDVTALVLTIGVMFFSKSMGHASAIFVWFFIICLTGFSWLVNYEYAAHFQSVSLTSNVLLTMLNPIFASSFAFLNLAYSIVSSVFDTKQETLEALQAKAQKLEETKVVRERIKAARKGTGLIATVKETVKELQDAVNDVNGISSYMSEHTTDPLGNSELIESEQEIPQKETPGEIPIVNITVHKKEQGRKQGGKASERVYKVLKVNPKASVSEIEAKAKVSRGYASRIRAQYLSEQEAYMSEGVAGN